MADRMTTRRRAAGAAAQSLALPLTQQASATASSPFMTGALPLINVQPPIETQSSRRSSTEPDDVLPPLPEIPNPEKLKDITTLKLKDGNFREWKNLMESQFNHYGIKRIIDGTYGPPTAASKLAHWYIIEQLFDMAFAASLPSRIYEDTKKKTSLREKWLTILKHHIHTDLGKITTDLFNIKFEAKEKIEDFVLRLQDTWENLERCGYPTDTNLRIEQLLSKLEPVFPAETRELRRSRDVRTLRWDYVIEVFKDVEHTRPTASSSTGAALAVQGQGQGHQPGPRRPKSSQSLRN